VNDTKRKIREACKTKNIPLCRMLAAANIQTGDYYQAVNEKNHFSQTGENEFQKCLILQK